MKRNVKFDTEGWDLPRKRLYWKYRKLKSFQKLADEKGINVKHVYDYISKGIIPANPEIQRRMGIPRKRPGVTINQLLKLPIQEMPTLVLKLTLENRS